MTERTPIRQLRDGSSVTFASQQHHIEIVIVMLISLAHAVIDAATAHTA